MRHPALATIDLLQNILKQGTRANKSQGRQSYMFRAQGLNKSTTSAQPLGDYLFAGGF